MPAPEKPSILWAMLKWLLILAVLGGIGYGGYYAYKKGYLDSLIEKFRKKDEELPPEIPETEPELPKSRPKPKGPTPEERIAALKMFAKKKEDVGEVDEFVPIEKLRKPKVAEAPGKSSFEKLKKIQEEGPVQKPVKKSVRKAKSKDEVIERLRKIRKR